MKTLLVISIGIVAALLWLRFTPVGINDKNATQENTAKLVATEVLKTPLTAFRVHVGRYPTTEEGIAALFRAPRDTESSWKGPYISGERLPLDPWGREYQYRSPALKSTAGYDVWSVGPDGVPSADDIGNWKS